MSYKPLTLMTDAELEREAKVWDRAVVESQISAWVDAADRNRNAAYAELSRRRARRKAGEASE